MQKTLDKQLDCQQKNSKGKKINHESFLHNILFSQHSDDPLDSNLWMIMMILYTIKEFPNLN